METAIYRVAQESLTNVLRHADATNASAIVRVESNTLTAIVEDDGVGFSPSEAADSTFGLAGMRERLTHLDGTLEIHSEPGRGTLIRAEARLT